jgi:hypothetical protein
MARIPARLIWAAAICLTVAHPSAAETPAETEFQRGYYLQTHEHDLDGAERAFEKVAADESAPDAIRREARERLSQIREDRAAADLARLMPPDALAYVELREPGVHLGRLVQMLGLLPRSGEDHPPLPAPPSETRERFALPERFAISPALIAELQKFGGVAAAVTSFEERSGPMGVVIVRPGESDLVRGLIETAVQVLPPAEPVHGFPTWRLLKDGWIVQTSRLFVISPLREEVEAAVDRLNDPELDNLSRRSAIREFDARRSDSLLFAYVNGQKVIERVYQSPRLQDDLRFTRVLLDLEHLKSLTASVGTTDTGVHAEIRLDLAEGHRSLPYALVHTAPLSRRSLECVPAGIAGLALVGLNPARQGPAAERGESQTLSAMDLGREVFENIEELALFVLPATAAVVEHSPIPEMGLVISSRDPQKSEALWTQLLTLPAALAAPHVQGPFDVTLDGHAGKEYRFRDAPAVVLVRLADRGVIVGTRAAVSAAVAACRNGESLSRDAAFQPLLEELTPTSSKAILVDVARAVGVAASSARGRQAEDFQTAERLLEGLRVSLVADEGPNTLAVRLQASGLPDVPTIVRTLLERERSRPGRSGPPEPPQGK